MLEQGIEEAANAEVLVDRAVAAANRSGQSRSWNFVTLQIQIAAEPWRASTIAEVRPTNQTLEVRRGGGSIRLESDQEPDLRRNPEIAFLNWFEATRQVDRCGAELVVAVPDEPTAAYIAAEYERIVHAAAAAEGITQVRLLPHAAAEPPNPAIHIADSTAEPTASALMQQTCQSHR